jgi:hypothetical protein
MIADSYPEPTESHCTNFSFRYSRQQKPTNSLAIKMIIHISAQLVEQLANF